MSARERSTIVANTSTTVLVSFWLYENPDEDFIERYPILAWDVRKLIDDEDEYGNVYEENERYSVSPIVSETYSEVWCLEEYCGNDTIWRWPEIGAHMTWESALAYAREQWQKIYAERNAARLKKPTSEDASTS